MSGPSLSSIHAAVDEAVDAVASDVLALARAIHADPEVARTEVRSSRACAGLLEAAGFTVTWGEGDLNTAFRATIDTGVPGPRIAILGEYDALPGIGHGCGHNLIAGASIGAALALARAGVPNGSIEVLGCPAEEIGFGKPAMLRAGMFDGITGAVAFHGAPFCAPARRFNAMRARSYVFAGATGHAGVAPWLGKNALDAAVAFYTATAQLRQHSMDAERVHGILTETGEAWNVVPDRAVARFGVRAQSSERADVLIERLDQVARGAAEMHDCEVTFEDTESMQPLTYNAELADLAAEHLLALGYAPGEPITVGASTDVGDVSEVV
ncbi:MAG: amidohydrolase, partial [Solirubrobacteraceae bacterium]|nr:amidohydrolase [Solirubrobacteraceae bacterium]